MFFVLLGMALGMSSSALANDLEVIPLNSNSEKVLKNSPLSSYVVSLDQAQETFHKKTILAYQKMSSFVDFKKVEPLDFVYDSHFLTESAFFSKYPSMAKTSLSKARQIASEVYAK